MELFDKVFKNWSEPLQNVRGSDFNRLINKLGEEYKEKSVVPEQKKVFKAFDMVEPSNLQIVIVGQDPYPDFKAATGYAFANNHDMPKLSASLQLIRDQIEKSVYNGLLLDFDPTLTHWANQGILGLNTALTVLYKRPMSHQKMWEKVFAKIITDLNNNFENLHFCFWGNVAKGFSSYVNPSKHQKLFYYHPAYAIRKHTAWECPHFEEINKTLDIKW